MDTLAHGLWAGLLAKGNQKTKSVTWWTIFFGTFPDLLGFGWVFVYIFYQKIFLNISTTFGPGAVIDPFISLWSNYTYAWGHSLLVWGLVFTLVYFLTKKVFWPFFGWLLHILVDIPTHTIEFYPTPFLWPLSEYRFNGFSWGQGWFMIFNYGSLLLVFLYLKFDKQIKKVLGRK